VQDACLIVVDVQNDFMPHGALAVPRAVEVVAPINALAQHFANVVLTQDWHTPRHASFASSHPGTKPFDTIELAYGPEVLWPDHCVQGSAGAALHAGLPIPHAQLVIRKDFHSSIDSYSAFVEADRRTVTGLQAYLRACGPRRSSPRGFVCRTMCGAGRRGGRARRAEGLDCSHDHIDTGN